MSGVKNRSASVFFRMPKCVVVCLMISVTIILISHFPGVESTKIYDSEFLSKDELLQEISDIRSGGKCPEHNVHQLKVPLDGIVSSHQFVDLTKTVTLLSFAINLYRPEQKHEDLYRWTMLSTLFKGDFTNVEQAWFLLPTDYLIICNTEKDTRAANMDVKNKPWYLSGLPWPDDKFYDPEKNFRDLGSDEATAENIRLMKSAKLRKKTPQLNSRVRFTKRSLSMQEEAEPKISNKNSKTTNFMNFKLQVSKFIATSRRKRSTHEVYADTEVRWTYPYFDCAKQKWLASIAVFNKEQKNLLVVDVDLTSIDINQCDPFDEIDQQYHHDEFTTTVVNIDDVNNTTVEYKYEDEQQVTTEPSWIQDYGRPPYLNFFHGTHKCHHSTRCVAHPGQGWKAGSYNCVCRDRHYNKELFNVTVFDGLMAENAFHQSNISNDNTYSMAFMCTQCAPNCTSCTSGAPCLSTYNWPFRIALLTISMGCIVFTVLLIIGVHQQQSVQVFKVASPVFLNICLTGCIIMYSEMAAIFPELNKPFCIATKWTRHMGFCITFSSLLMKTWRVSLTYRVKSAHKIKLTDNQLLIWLTPILMIMSVYLLAWTVSDPPRGDVITDQNGLLFKQCTYDWWDHSLAAGEMMFLIWGVKVCFSVRKAESLFDEAKMISFAVYNITAVNILMAVIHISANVGPDMKYFFGFLRTQLSTTTTIILIFAPKVATYEDSFNKKFREVLKQEGTISGILREYPRGTGDDLDRNLTFNASFNKNGKPGDENVVPLDQENEELKEEIQKLAARMEFMKTVHMTVSNRHLKPKPGGFFSERGGLLAVCNTNTSLLGNSSLLSSNFGTKTLGNTRNSTATVVSNKAICEETSDLPNSDTVNSIPSSRPRKESLVKLGFSSLTTSSHPSGNVKTDLNDDIEMTKIKPTDV